MTQFVESATRLAIVTPEVDASHGVLPRPRCSSRGNATASSEMIESSSLTPHCDAVQEATSSNFVNLPNERSGRIPASVRGIMFSEVHVIEVKVRSTFALTREDPSVWRYVGEEPVKITTSF